MGRTKQKARRSKHRNQNGDRQQREDSNRTGYQLTERNNEVFELYYKGQGIVPEGEWDDFMATLRQKLPSTFRITGNRSQSKQILQHIKDNLASLATTEDEGGLAGVDNTPMEPPKCLPWYPAELGWQIDLDRKTIRFSEQLKKLHQFLVSETESGYISRQEAVSMIPPLVLDVQPHHKVLDMCAAPGSKTAQLIELLHQDESKPIPEGVVIANDSDNKRCYMMVHQVKRLASPCFLIVNQDATVIPNFKLDPATKGAKFMKFDRILADVPCSGDGTMRKNPGIWGKWNPGTAHNLHSIQKRILMRAISLLEDEGRIVYSTCSLNPIEDEAVVANVLKDHIGELELVDISGELPGLKTMPGISKWKVMTRDKEWFSSHDEVPQRLHTHINQTMFPPPEVDQIGLHKCIRLLPHHQNSGGFFVAVIRRIGARKSKRTETVTSDSQTEHAETSGGTEAAENKEEQAAECPPPKKKQKFHQGFKEDPFFFIDSDDESFWLEVKAFFGIGDDFPVNQLMIRCKEGKKRNIYFTSRIVKTLTQNNEDQIKFINMGMKVLSRSESRHVEACDYRLVQEGVDVMEPYITKRRVTISKEDVITLLDQENPFLDRMTKDAQKQMHGLGQGGVLFIYEPDDRPDSPRTRLALAGWLGKTSCRSFLPKHDRAHILRLCGVELKSKEEKMAERAKEKAPAAATQGEADEVAADEADEGVAEMSEETQEEEAGGGELDLEDVMMSSEAKEGEESTTKAEEAAEMKS